MNIGEAYAICKNIETSKATDEEKGLAIHQMMEAPTHNGITKTELLCIIKYLHGMCFEMMDHEDRHPGVYR